MVEFRLELPTLTRVATQPGVSELWRFVIHYPDGAHPDQAADLIISLPGQPSAALTIHYRRGTDHPTILQLKIPATRARSLANGMRNLGFDRLEDMPAIPWHGAELWLIARGAGTFSRDLVLAPGTAQGVYAQIVALVRIHLYEAIRPASR